MPIGKGFAFLMGIGSMAFGAVGIYLLVKGVVDIWGHFSSLPALIMEDQVSVLWLFVITLFLPIIALFVSYKLSRYLSSGWKGMIVLVMLLASVVALLSYSNLPFVWG
jgi:hypothetical protein